MKLKVVLYIVFILFFFKINSQQDNLEIKKRKKRIMDKQIK